MQTNEFVGQVRENPRRPRAKQSLTSSRVTPGTREQRVDADESHRRAARQPASKPRQYGAGF
jgi:hypothetical protein